MQGYLNLLAYFFCVRLFIWKIAYLVNFGLALYVVCLLNIDLSVTMPASEALALKYMLCYS